MSNQRSGLPLNCRCAIIGGLSQLLTVAKKNPIGERLLKGSWCTGQQQKTNHSLRHTAITNAVLHDAPLHKVKCMARHASIETTMIYYHEVDRLEDRAEGYIDNSNGNVQ